MAANTATGRPGRHAFRQGGFAYLLFLSLIVLMGAGLAAIGTHWDTAGQRTREQELLYVGNQYRQAIGRFYQLTPGPTKRYPASLDDLLKDPRVADTVRHLRRPFRDPITRADWGLVQAPEGGIMGIYSTSEQRPRKLANFDLPDRVFEEVAQLRGEQLRYTDWQFVYRPPVPLLQPGGLAATPGLATRGLSGPSP